MSYQNQTNNLKLKIMKALTIKNLKQYKVVTTSQGKAKVLTIFSCGTIGLQLINGTKITRFIHELSN